MPEALTRDVRPRWKHGLSAALRDQSARVAKHRNADRPPRLQIEIPLLESSQVNPPATDEGAIVAGPSGHLRL